MAGDLFPPHCLFSPCMPQIKCPLLDKLEFITHMPYRENISKYKSHEISMKYTARIIGIISQTNFVDSVLSLKTSTRPTTPIKSAIKAQGIVNPIPISTIKSDSFPERLHSAALGGHWCGHQRPPCGAAATLRRSGHP